ncbi:hypothetical protein G3N57_00655 [Paraburkholderia sp. Se-20369]|nr:hypothetical protein [Paraburkholderia sp. Se-20369]
MQNNAIKKVVFGALVVFAGVGAGIAHAQSNEAYAGVGSDGFGVGYGYSFSRYGNVRAEVDGFGLSHGFTGGDIHYDGSVKLVHGAVFGDFFPAPSVVPFRFTAGLLIGGDNFSGDATSMSGTYTLNGVAVPANGETIHAKLKYPAVRPYVGIGFGHTALAKKGFSVAFDAGVAYGKPTVSFDVPTNIAVAVGQENVDAERQKLQSKANNLKFYPIVKVALTYRF